MVYLPESEVTTDLRTSKWRDTCWKQEGWTEAVLSQVALFTIAGLKERIKMYTAGVLCHFVEIFYIHIYYTNSFSAWQISGNDIE